MTTQTLCTVEAFQSAAEFLRALEDSSRWAPADAWYSPWVFRGQRSAAWSLTPSAWRSPETPALRRLASIRDHVLEAHRDQVLERLQSRPQAHGLSAEYILAAYAQARAEFQVVLEFVEMADRLGHPVPGMARYMSLREYDWMPELQSLPRCRFVIEPNSATTLAQHHGIPTRYLDWTRSASTAAFFAVQDIEIIDPHDAIAVWAVRPDLLVKHGAAAADNEDGLRFLSFETPRAENLYLNAQDGLFLYPAAACEHYAARREWPGLERFADQVAQVLAQPILRKLTLVSAEVPELMRLLWLAGVSRAHLMPTYDNITAALVTKWRWHP